MKLEDLKQYEEDYKIVPIKKEYYADTLTPVQVLRRLKQNSDKLFLLESANNSGARGRYSFLGVNPEMEVIVKNNQVIFKNGEEIIIESSDPSAEINKFLENYSSPKIKGMPPFTGGLVGYVSYDYYKYTEPILNFNNPDPYEFNDLHLLLFNDLIVFDHFSDKVSLITNIETDDLENNYKKGIDRINQLKLEIENAIERDFSGKISKSFKPVFTMEEYSELIKKAQDYIVEGDIFQVVPSNRIKGEFHGSLFPAYRVLRSDNPSPYMYYFQINDIEIIGTSPETLVKLENDKITTFPIAGSRPRGRTIEKDDQLTDELLKDKKELAEHNMLVDLGRNDIGRVSKRNSVKVEEYLKIQKYSKVMHITSVVSGSLEDGITPLHALSNILPAGTLSGAPKIRACQIIEELETEKRGPYGGALGYIGFNGNMDMCIAIRSAFKNKNKMFVQSGGGIVKDSKFKNEYEETINKASAIIEAIQKSENLDNDFNIR